MMVSIEDNFASPEEISAALAAWPENGWHTYESAKRVSEPGAIMPEPIALLLHRMAIKPTGMIPDLGLWGAGLHELPPGSELDWHVDAERHAHLGLSRSLSGILWLCGDGDLEFRDGVMIRPTRGRCAIFDGSAMHRVNRVTKVRRSISLFWYGKPLAQGRTRAAFEGDKCH